MLERYNHFINLIYEASTDFGYWEDIINQLVITTQSSSSVFLIVDTKHPERNYGEFLVNVDPYHRNLYEAGHYNRIDKFSIQLGYHPGYTIHSTEAVYQRPELFLEQEVEEDFFRKYGYDFRLGLAIPYDSHQHICLYLNRSKQDGDFCNPRETSNFINLLAPHIKRSISLCEKISLNSDIINCLSNSFSDTSTGIILLDRNKKIIFLNQQAELLSKEYSHLLSCRERFSCKSHKSTIDSYINNAIATLEHAPSKPGGVLSIPGIDPHKKLEILISPIKLNHLSCSFFRKAAAAIFLTPAEIKISCKKTLQQLYSLTPTEASIAIDFSNNPDLKSIATQRKRNLETLRSQLKSIMRKMDVNKQTELLRKIVQGSCKLNNH
jgi:DNA-binding CsgD family transcriptional regulator